MGPMTYRDLHGLINAYPQGLLLGDYLADVQMGICRGKDLPTPGEMTEQRRRLCVCTSSEASEVHFISLQRGRQRENAKKMKARMGEGI